MMNITDFEKCFFDFNVIDCVVREKNLFSFIAREDYTRWSKSKWNPEKESLPDEYEIKKRIVSCRRDSETNTLWGAQTLTGYGRLSASSTTKPKPQFVGVSLTGDVYAIGSGEKGAELDMRPWDEGGPSRGGIHKLRTIDGWLYFCGGGNSVGKRIDKNEWFSHSHNIPNPKREDNLYNSLDDIDGFSEQDIYCVGNEGRVLHYDGKLWKTISFPTTMDLETVCCAGDGNVYISGRKGTTYKGRGNAWQLIHTGELSLPFRDMVWHEDQVWCTSDYGVWTIKNNKVESAKLPDGMNVYAGNLSVGDGVLLLAGYGGAAFMENGQWHKIFSATEMNRLMK
jgi:hypothetical protein